MQQVAKNIYSCSYLLISLNQGHMSKALEQLVRYRSDTLTDPLSELNTCFPCQSSKHLAFVCTWSQMELTISVYLLGFHNFMADLSTTSEILLLKFLKQHS